MQTTRHTVTIDDAVITIIALVAERAELTGSRPRIHRAFCSASRLFPRMLEDLHFDSNATNWPWSEDLDQIISRFVLSGRIRFTISASPRLVMSKESIKTVRDECEQVVCRAIGYLYGIVNFMCNQENYRNLLYEQISAPTN